MAWTAPMTAVANAIFTAAQFNTHVRDNLLETAPAKATTAAGHFVATGANAIVERVPTSAFVATYESTSGTTFGDLATPGPAVTVTTGTRALVLIQAYAESAGEAARQAHASFAVSGATTLAASSDYSVNSYNGTVQAGTSHWVPLTAGSNTFTMKYRRNGGTGNVFFSSRRITVIPF